MFGFVNFAWVLVESVVVGDALNGYQTGGHFFVLHKPGYTEVSQALWEWLRFHGASIFVTHPLAIAGVAWFAFGIDWPRAIAGRKTSQEKTARIELIRSTGPALSTAKSGGSIGRLRLPGPMIKVSVYPGGIVVKPLFMAEHAVLASEIDHVTATRAWTRREVTIEHTGVDMKSPLVLYVKGDSEIFAAIRSVGDPVSYRAEQSADARARDLPDLKWRDQ